MSDPLDQLCAGTGRQCGEGLVTRRPIADARARLDEFVVGECAGHFCGDPVGQAVLSDRHQWVQGVAQATQVFLLTFIQFHAGIIGGRWGGGLPSDG